MRTSHAGGRDHPRMQMYVGKAAQQQLRPTREQRRHRVPRVQPRAVEPTGRRRQPRGRRADEAMGEGWGDFFATSYWNDPCTASTTTATRRPGSGGRVRQQHPHVQRPVLGRVRGARRRRDLGQRPLGPARGARGAVRTGRRQGEGRAPGRGRHEEHRHKPHVPERARRISPPTSPATRARTNASSGALSPDGRWASRRPRPARPRLPPAGPDRPTASRGQRRGSGRHQQGVDTILSAAGSSLNGDAPFTYEWDLDNDGQYDDATGASVSFTAVGQDGFHTIGLRVTNSERLLRHRHVDGHSDRLRPRGRLRLGRATAGRHGRGGDGDDQRPGLARSPNRHHRLGRRRAPAGRAARGSARERPAGCDPRLRRLARVRRRRRLSSPGVRLRRRHVDLLTVPVTVTNVAPTATIDEGGTVLVNGVPTIITNAGGSVVVPRPIDRPRQRRSRPVVGLGRRSAVPGRDHEVPQRRRLRSRS